jgi:predicted DNA-binding ribbon-helix-helix protein
MVHFSQTAPRLSIAPNYVLAHNGDVRTSITLDEDVYQHATLYARGRGVTLSTALSEIARKGVEAMHATNQSSRLKRAPNGLLIIPSDGRVITSEMVKAALEEDGF